MSDTGKNAIRRMEANSPGGNDLVIGDLHGNRECLQAVLDSMQENDRLFLVGDLTDRGSDSLGVIKLLERYKNKVFAVKGNHESMCLACIAALEKRVLREDFKEWMDELDKFKSGEMDTGFFFAKCESEIINYVFNGGEWMLKLYDEELSHSKISVSGHVVQYSEGSEVNRIKRYMESLPYIIQVKGAHPFNVVHADMPVNDDELAKRIEKGSGLTDEEIIYATWARENGEVSIRNTGRTPTSILAVAGHSIVAHGKVSPIRKNTNTIDIDAGSYATHVSLVVNITQRTCYYLGKGREAALKNRHLMRVQDQINLYLSGT